MSLDLLVRGALLALLTSPECVKEVARGSQFGLRCSDAWHYQSFGSFNLDAVDLNVRKQTVRHFEENGAGKVQLMNVLYGLYSAG